jgi:hypothetical protein
MLTSNLVFSQWDRIFKDPMTTACAIDRLVHHATILELTRASYREEGPRRSGRAVEGKAAHEGSLKFGHARPPHGGALRGSCGPTAGTTHGGTQPPG